MNMRYYINDDAGMVLIVGEAKEIKAVAGSMWRANRKRRGEMGIRPAYQEKPRFRLNEAYGILISRGEDGDCDCWMILNASGVIRELVLRGGQL